MIIRDSKGRVPVSVIHRVQSIRENLEHILSTHPFKGVLRVDSSYENPVSYVNSLSGELPHPFLFVQEEEITRLQTMLDSNYPPGGTKYFMISTGIDDAVDPGRVIQELRDLHSKRKVIGCIDLLRLLTDKEKSGYIWKTMADSGDLRKENTKVGLVGYGHFNNTLLTLLLSSKVRGISCYSSDNRAFNKGILAMFEGERIRIGEKELRKKTVFDNILFDSDMIVVARGPQIENPDTFFNRPRAEVETDLFNQGNARMRAFFDAAVLHNYKGLLVLESTPVSAYIPMARKYGFELDQITSISSDALRTGFIVFQLLKEYVQGESIPLECLINLEQIECKVTGHHWWPHIISDFSKVKNDTLFFSTLFQDGGSSFHSKLAELVRRNVSTSDPSYQDSPYAVHSFIEEAISLHETLSGPFSAYCPLKIRDIEKIFSLAEVERPADFTETAILYPSPTLTYFPHLRIGQNGDLSLPSFTQKRSRNTEDKDFSRKEKNIAVSLAEIILRDYELNKMRLQSIGM
ncbi:hypothetical protein HYZ97_01460 [Candidatus Pacearchaeota archaeon]|nr:hypothetical protein [Candidatus Pacearchaeota archaeon]